MFGYCQVNTDKGPLEELGGLSCYDADSYKKEMKRCGSYECLVCFSDVELLAFCHRSLLPTVGILTATSDEKHGSRHVTVF